MNRRGFLALISSLPLTVAAKDLLSDSFASDVAAGTDLALLTPNEARAKQGLPRLEVSPELFRDADYIFTLAVGNILLAPDDLSVEYRPDIISSSDLRGVQFLDRWVGKNSTEINVTTRSQAATQLQVGMEESLLISFLDYRLGGRCSLAEFSVTHSVDGTWPQFALRLLVIGQLTCWRAE